MKDLSAAKRLAELMFYDKGPATTYLTVERAAGSQVPPTSSVPAQSDTAAQVCVLRQADGSSAAATIRTLLATMFIDR